MGKRRLLTALYRKSPSIIRKLIRRSIASNAKQECESVEIREIWKAIYGVDIGMYSYGCFNDTFPAGTTVGSYCSISKQVKCLNANHPINDVCMTPYFYNASLGYDVKDVFRSHLTVGNDVWIGYGTIILSKCTHIGNGAVIGAGSVVTKDVPPYAVVAGNPAKIIKYRFDEITQETIEQTKWWEKTPDELMAFKDCMNNPEVFAAAITEEEHVK